MQAIACSKRQTAWPRSLRSCACFKARFRVLEFFFEPFKRVTILFTQFHMRGAPLFDT